jgi:ribosome-binding ATPase
MNLSVGIVGLPNVGKSTLFNALLKRQMAFVANYPFATIEPNIGVVPVPDERLQRLAEITAREIASPREAGLAMTQLRQGSEGQADSGQVPIKSGQARMTKLPPIKPATVEFVDIAGLVKGASEGAGLGNKFLSHIREVKVICHLVRVFEDPDIIREGSVDPKSDFETIETELILADLQSMDNLKFKVQNSKLQFKIKSDAIDKLKHALDKGIPARSIILSKEENEAVSDLFLLTSKPEIVVLNVSEGQYNPEGIKRAVEKYREILRLTSFAQDDNVIVISAKIEAELAVLSEDEQKEYLKGLGLDTSGLERLIQKAYSTLGLISFLTTGEIETRAWTIRRGFTALAASGEIHTDFMKKFIKAEVVAYEDFVANKGWKGSREAGKARMEGREYIVQDGDTIEFKIGA